MYHLLVLDPRISYEGMKVDYANDPDLSDYLESSKKDLTRLIMLINTLRHLKHPHPKPLPVLRLHHHTHLKITLLPVSPKNDCDRQ
jgi:hypothetical protein